MVLARVAHRFGWEKVAKYNKLLLFGFQNPATLSDNLEFLISCINFATFLSECFRSVGRLGVDLLPGEAVDVVPGVVEEGSSNQRELHDESVEEGRARLQNFRHKVVVVIFLSALSHCDNVVFHGVVFRIGVITILLSELVSFHLMQCLLDDGPQPDDEVGGDQMDETQVGQPSAQVDVESGVEDHHHYLEADEDQGEEADDRAGDIIAVRVEVDDEILNELQEMIDEGAQTKHNRPLSEEAAAVRLDVVVAGWKSGQVEEDVEEEETGDGVEETQQDVELRLREVVEVGVGELVDRHRDVDREDQQAVQTRERPAGGDQTAAWSGAGSGRSVNN